MAGRNKTYTPEEIAAALAVVEANEGIVYRAAKQTGIKESTLRNWYRGSKSSKGVGLLQEDGTAVVGGVGGPIPAVAAAALPLVPQQIKSLADRLDAIAWRLVGSVKRADIMSSTLPQRMVALGIAVDKSRLLRGEPGQITADATAPPPDLSRLSPAERDRLEELLARAEGKAGPVDMTPDDSLPWERQAHGSAHDLPIPQEIPAIAGDS